MSPPFSNFPLLKVSIQRVERFPERAWLDKLVLLHTAKTKMFHLPDIARPETISVFAEVQRQPALVAHPRDSWRLSDSVPEKTMVGKH